jgi:hypothetical protein
MFFSSMVLLHRTVLFSPEAGLSVEMARSRWAVARPSSGVSLVPSSIFTTKLLRPIASL